MKHILKDIKKYSPNPEIRFVSIWSTWVLSRRTGVENNFLPTVLDESNFEV